MFAKSIESIDINDYKKKLWDISMEKLNEVGISMEWHRLDCAVKGM